MYFKSFLFLLIIGLLFISQGSAQDLIRKVPADANFLVTVNNKAIFKHLSMDDVNGLFTNLGFFQKVFSKEATVQKLEDMGIDFSTKAYFYVTTSDSVQYVGGLIPLANANLFEKLIGESGNLETVNGLKTVYAKDRTLRVSWDNHAAYIMGGITNDSFFEQEDVRKRYGLPEDLSNSYYLPPYRDNQHPPIDETLSYDTVAPAVKEAPVNTTTREGTMKAPPMAPGYPGASVQDTLPSNDAIPAPVPSAKEFWEEEYRRADSILAREEYQDDYYKKSRQLNATSDSLINVLISGWVDERIGEVINGKVKGYSSNKGFSKLSDNTILDFRIRNFDAIFSSVYYPIELLYMGFGVGGKPQIDHGIEEIAGQVVVNGNKLILQGEASLDREMTRYYKEIYARKINPKFLRYLDRETLGFMSFNVHTEAYLKYFPKIMDRYYGSLGIRYNDFVGLGTLLFDVLLDEKAIAKVFKGDNLMLVNGFEEMEVTYTDYKYDENFQYQSIERTKKETVPQFLWMFSSDDFRIFDKLIEIAAAEGQVQQEDGLYKLKKRQRDPIQMYVLMQEGIVFLSNDVEKLKAIQSKRYTGRGHKPYVDMAKKNSFSLLVNTEKFPDFADQLGVPMGRSTQQIIHEMKEYGDFHMVSPGMKRNKLTGQIGLEFPPSKGNALSFMLDLINRWASDVNPKRP